MLDTARTLADFLESVAVIAAAGVAIFGINSWRREHVGKRRIELAEEALSLFYEARDVINSARSEISFDGEWKEAEKQLEHTQHSTSASIPVRIVSWRLHRRDDLFAKIRAMRYRFKAVFKCEKPFLALTKIKIKVISAERRLARKERILSQSSEEDNNEELERHNREIDELDLIVYGGGEETDPLAPELDRVIQEIENICGPIINEATARLK